MEYFVMFLCILIIVFFSIVLVEDFEETWGVLFFIALFLAVCFGIVHDQYENGYKDGAVDVLENKIEWKKGEKGWEKVGLKPEVDTVYVIVQDTCKHNQNEYE